MERLIGTKVPCPDEALPHVYGAHKSGGRKPAEFYTSYIQNSKSNIPHLPICLTIKSKNFILGLQYSEIVVYSLPNCWAILPVHHSKQHQNQDNHYEKKEFIKKILSSLTKKTNDELDKEYYINMLSRLTNFSKSALVTLMNSSTNHISVDDGKKVPASARPISDRYQEAQKDIHLRHEVTRVRN